MFLRYFKLQHCLVLTILNILNINYGELNNNNNQRFYTNATAMHNFRFRDFEPRNIFKSNSHQLVENTRKPRGFQFHADNRDINVDLEFIVPLVRIPIERSVSVTQTAIRSLFNLNLHSLLATGAIVTVGGLFAIILKIIFAQYVYIRDYRKSLRNEDADQQDSIVFNPIYNKNNSFYSSSLFKFATILESKLQENNINISHCLQSSLCSYYQKNFCGSGTHNQGWPRILEGVLSLDIIRNYISNTAIKDVFDTARDCDNCLRLYSNNCNWSVPSKGIWKLIAENFIT